MAGSGDIAPYVAAVDGAGTAMEQTLLGAAAGLIAVDRRGGDVHDRRVPPGPDPHHLRRQPSPWPGPGGQGHRHRRGHLHRRARRGHRRGHVGIRCCGPTATPSSRSAPSPRSASSPGPRRCSLSPPSLALGAGRDPAHGAGAVTAVITAIFLPYLLALTFCPQVPRTGCCGSPRPRASRSSRPSRPTRRWPPPTRRPTTTSPCAPWAGFAVLCGLALRPGPGRHPAAQAGTHEPGQGHREAVPARMDETAHRCPARSGCWWPSLP